ncbi:RHS repeat domain-containing protein [Trujillonella humicola]|uniref:RHS repeat domain-containing protein n=1 Tax=Trujillonella humicola TaxID=3383699 RepID=UPI003905C9E2
MDYSDTTPDVSYTYDTAGRIATRTDATGTTAYAYDPLGRLTARNNPTGADPAYSYDRTGNLASATNAAGTTTYSYDTRNLVTTLTGPDGRRVDFAHDDTGRRTDTWFHVVPVGYDATTWAAHTHTDYDAASRITRTWTARASNDATRVSDISYSYASPGPAVCPGAPPVDTDTSLRWRQTDHLTARTTTYCYDPANRLTSATTPGGDTWVYTYNTNGDRTSTTLNGTVVQSLAFNNADQITTGGYSYDASGNATAAPSLAATVTYNGAEQMTNRTTTGSAPVNVDYTYAGTDQVELTAISRDGRAYAYGRTDGNGLPIIESFTHGGTTYSYLYDPQGTPLAWLGGNAHYLAMDGLGSPTALINHNGAQTGAYTYDPYGRTTATPIGGSAAIQYQIYGYAGGFDDPTSTLIHFGKRWYDPTTGRWTQQDSVEVLGDPGRGNRYEYAGSNPINRVDPTGMYSWEDFWGDLAGGTTTVVFTLAGVRLGGVRGGIVGYTVGSCIGGFVGDNLTAILKDESPTEGDAIGSCIGGALSAFPGI